MNINDFETVRKLIQQMERIDDAISVLDDYSSDRDEEGYGCTLSRCHDGSGVIVNLTGCYVANEMREAAESILAGKRVEVIEKLKYLGVEV